MLSNQLPAKICFLIEFESTFNQLFDLKLLPDLIEIIATIPIRTIYIESSSILIKNVSNLIENGQKWTDFHVFGRRFQ